MEQKRLTAIKTSIKPIIEGKYVKGEGFESNYVLTPTGLKISRARILGTVMTKFVNDDRTYGFVVIDDQTETIRAKIFKNLKLIENINQGDLVDAIGKVREYDGELYVMPEVIRKIDNPNFIILRKAELLEQSKTLENVREKIQGFKKQTSDLEEIKKLAQAEGIEPEITEAIVQSMSQAEEIREEKETGKDKKPVKEMILEIIDRLDEGTGAEYSAIITESKMDEPEVEEVINELLGEGTCYEPRPGRIKRL
ncbi:MAG: hypothetical protein JSV92_00045 [archaeon]|nr:MAG: hypothetical protein JSV92_00045 [archaeon]